MFKGGIMEFGNCLKVWRAKRDITQADLAMEVGLSRQTINSIEKGKFIPSALSAMRISRFFGVPIEDIFFIKEEE